MDENESRPAGWNGEGYSVRTVDGDLVIIRKDNGHFCVVTVEQSASFLSGLILDVKGQR